MKILAIETSCDETACAIVEDGTNILGSSIASSTAMHEKYGGIVPEVAAREQLKCIIPAIEEALSQANIKLDAIDSLAVTVGPGLIGSLLIGVETAKTIAMKTEKPIIPVNHVLAHMYANLIGNQHLEFPAISLVVSGGHTELFLMESTKQLKWLGGTLDDAAGEAFDKAARLLGFGGRGGVTIQEAASKFKIQNSAFRTKLPRPMLDEKNVLNFSFSGLKTAILREVNKLKANNKLNGKTVQQMAYEVQEAITDVLVEKTLRAAKKCQSKSILISGGVASNLRLRNKFAASLSSLSPKLSFFVPPVSLCTDNAVYIAACAFFRGKPVDWHKITAAPDLSVEV